MILNVFKLTVRFLVAFGLMPKSFKNIQLYSQRFVEALILNSFFNLRIYLWLKEFDVSIRGPRWDEAFFILVPRIVQIVYSEDGFAVW